MHESKPQRFTAHLKCGSRQYFIDVKHGSLGAYMTITESRPINGVFEKKRILVDAEHFGAFAELVAKAVGAAGPPRSYTEWTPAEDDLLRAGFRVKRGIAEMAHIHAREPGAIRSRLRHLGLK